MLFEPLIAREADPILVDVGIFLEITARAIEAKSHELTNLHH